MWYDITYIDEDDSLKPERHIRTQDRKEFIATLKAFKQDGVKVTDLTGENKNAINHTIKPPIPMKLYKPRENIPNNKREVERWVTIGRKKNTNIQKRCRKFINKRNKETRRKTRIKSLRKK